MSRPLAAILARRGLATRGGAALPRGRRARRPADAAGAAGACELILAHVRAARRSWSSATTTSTASARRRSWCGRCARSARDPAWELPSRFDDGLRTVGRRRSSGWPRRAPGCWSPSTAASPRSRRSRPRAQRARRDRHRPPPARRRSCRTARSCTRRSATTRCPELCAAGVALKLSEALYAAGRDPRGRAGPRPRRAGHRLRPRPAARREPAHRARGPGRARAHATSRACAP